MWNVVILDFVGWYLYFYDIDIKFDIVVVYMN